MKISLLVIIMARTQHTYNKNVKEVKETNPASAFKAPPKKGKIDDGKSYFTIFVLVA